MLTSKVSQAKGMIDMCVMQGVVWDKTGIYWMSAYYVLVTLHT